LDSPRIVPLQEWVTAPDEAAQQITFKLSPEIETKTATTICLFYIIMNYEQ